MYYYVYNLQGDVTHIIDASKNIVGTYQYDAWGKILNINNLTAIAQANPFRYRGYYYDNESGLYYLNSRYYNAEWGRFINADGYVSTGQDITGYNMFAYCGNNPINNVDPNGTCYYSAKGQWYHDNWENLGGYIKQPDPNTYNKIGINNIERTHFTENLLMLDAGYLYGKIGISSTVTAQNKEENYLYTFGDLGTDEDSVGFGYSLHKYWGLEIGYSSNLNIFAKRQISPYFHAQISIGADGVGAIIGLDLNEIAYDLEVQCGIGTVVGIATTYMFEVPIVLPQPAT